MSAPPAPPASPAPPDLSPVLVVRDAEAARAFYAAAFGAEGTEGPLRLGGVGLHLVPADRARGVLGAESFGGAAVQFVLRLSDPAAAAARAVAAGAVVLRQGPPLLLRDPFLHLWLLAAREG